MNEKLMTTETEMQTEERLWQAVILSTIRDWISGPLRLKRQAGDYLFNDNKDFPLVCQSAGMDVSRLRAKLTRLALSATPSQTHQNSA
jgi:hypothetical protein